ncbi:hypothetical protein K9N68_12685 [Kovacikia minuta CCNUW1]|uniref:hypothetical protein n=1 Tax=Kovacikia minuta TaxID=2931930 RepID=UPI001CCD3217|nr:hypothetical protein [Kovacikia minuta]UBF28652.1 hypothetical protein K9N68_12685 [Kovacikia minuta CCNUW1]
MNTEELTQVTTAQQSAISRHAQEMADIRTILREGFLQSEKEMAALRAQQALDQPKFCPVYRWVGRTPYPGCQLLTRQLLFLHILELRHDCVGCC